MNHDDTHRPASHHDAPHHAAPVAPGHPADAPTAPRRHAAPRPGRRPVAGGGNHRADARPRPGARTTLLAVAAVIAVSGSCLLLIRPGSGADQALAADASGAARPAVDGSAPQTLSSASHSPRRHRPSPTPSATERPAEQHPTPRTSASPSPSRSAGGTTSHAPRAGSGTGRTPSVARAATGTAAEYAQKVLDLVNAQRAQHGCGPLTIDPHIQTAAQAHSDDMAARNYYAHDTPEGVDPGTRLTNAGFRWQSWGENIFKSPNDPATAVDGWMNSPGHRANILNCSYTSTGVGVNLSSNGPWWTQDFATRG
ncbi:CAP domain-containing protein [Streptomyces yunnanensis]|uniref:Uncharacterized conserved protein YkwD, contains CAP (CSP/antigen 5/PR1) domain n=1 Tax=Streptomyces yunnanensis TaxID=156453 RepID=A0A9X8QZY8_9ACTN|nr:CAP domain-containing protein [Streptomyces yunnanensis]SHN28884.1 Uncharacterized conserved protein YkwD, contains CAP (CSP/antigen 5/PR1) domain [Streptomyces yunnanensis]